MKTELLAARTAMYPICNGPGVLPEGFQLSLS